MKYLVEVWYKPGVTDAVGQSVKKGIEDLGIKSVKSVSSGQVYLIEGNSTEIEIESICEKLLANSVIQNYKIKIF